MHRSVFIKLLLSCGIAFKLDLDNKPKTKQPNHMKRMKTYDVPHKGLRNALSQLSLLAGKTDYSNPEEVALLYQSGRDVFKILSIHAEDEDAITLAELEERCSGCSDHDKEDHQKIHTLQVNLENTLLKLYNDSKAGQDVSEAGDEFYLALSEFHGIYLEHTAEEERVTQALLWQHFSDEELAAHRSKIIAKNPPDTLLIWFRFVIPAQSHKERLTLLSGFKKMASTEFFNRGTEVIKTVLTQTEFEKLLKALEN